MKHNIATLISSIQYSRERGKLQVKVQSQSTSDSKVNQAYPWLTWYQKVKKKKRKRRNLRGHSPLRILAYYDAYEVTAANAAWRSEQWIAIGQDSQDNMPFADNSRTWGGFVAKILPVPAHGDTSAVQRSGGCWSDQMQKCYNYGLPREALPRDKSAAAQEEETCNSFILLSEIVSLWWQLWQSRERAIYIANY
jgi:hypothetical protein